LKSPTSDVVPDKSLLIRRSAKPTVLLVGGPDVDARIDLMRLLGTDFNCLAAGTDHQLASRFAQAGLGYVNYPMVRQFNPFEDMRTLRRLVQVMRTISPQVVHTFDTKPNIYGRIAAYRAKVPVIIGSVTGLGSLYTYQSRSVDVIRVFNEVLQRVTCSLADLTVFHNQEDHQYFLAHRLVSAEKSLVIPGSGVWSEGYDPAQYSGEDREAIKREIFNAADVTVVTCVARLIRSKGAAEFGEAARLVQARYPQARFMFVGASDEQSVDRLSGEEVDRLGETVTLTGYRRDISRLLAATDIFVLPSYREGISRVLLEAALMALPLVASDVPGCREIVIDRVTGLLVPPRNSQALAGAIIDLIEHSKLRRQYGLNARERVIQQYDLAQVASRVKEVYLSLLNGHSTAAAGGQRA
jgi:glycosyltransferase involved in cell wall biosynthesis